MKNSSKTSAITQLIKYFDDGNCWPLHLNEQKIRTRGQIVQDDEFPDSEIVLIERHRPILGSSYRFGLPMSAYQTYLMRFRISDDEKVVTALSEKPISVKTNPESMVNDYVNRGTIDFHVEQTAKDQYKIRESVSNSKAIVACLEDAIDFGREIAEQHLDFIYSQLKMEADDLNMSAQETDRLYRELTKSIIAAIDEFVAHAWQLHDESDSEGYLP